MPCFPFYSVQASWPKPSIDALGEDISVLVSFWNTLNADKKYLKSFTVSSSLDSVLEAPAERSSVYMSDKTYGDTVTQQVIYFIDNCNAKCLISLDFAHFNYPKNACLAARKLKGAQNCKKMFAYLV